MLISLFAGAALAVIPVLTLRSAGAAALVGASHVAVGGRALLGAASSAAVLSLALAHPVAAIVAMIVTAVIWSVSSRLGGRERYTADIVVGGRSSAAINEPAGLAVELARVEAELSRRRLQQADTIG